MSAYPVELEAPDISAYRAGNCGIDYVSTFDSGNPGASCFIAAEAASGAGDEDGFRRECLPYGLKA